MATKSEPIRICKGHKSPILNCIGTVKESDFYDSWNQFSDGKFFYCKDCVNKIWDYYLKATNNNTRISLWYCCQKFDLPFIDEIIARLHSRQENGDKSGRKQTISIKSYIVELFKNKTKKEIWTDFSSSDTNVLSLNNRMKEREEKEQRIKEIETKWGRQEELDDYEFLEKTFNRYTVGVEFINSQQEDLYRDLCRDRLILRKINDGRYSGEETIDKVQNRISRTMSTLKVDQFESSKPKTASEQLIFSKIAQIEQTKPADLYKEPRKYKDFNKVQKYYKDLVLRPLGNTLVGNRDFDINIEDINEYNIEVEDS